MNTKFSKMKAPVKPEVFQAMQSVDVDTLATFSETDLRPVLPGLVRMALCSPLDHSKPGIELRRATLIILSGMEVVNSIVGLLSIDFNSLEQDVKKEKQLRLKMGGNQTESTLIMQLTRALTHEFEQSDSPRRIRLVLSQLLFVCSELNTGKPNYFKQSELFESPVYLHEISDALCIAYAELPGVIPLAEMAEALLCLPNGTKLLCQLVANFPEHFMEVCHSLVIRGEKVEEDSLGGCRRLEVLMMLADMNPKEALSIRALCAEHCTMPGTAVALSLRMSSVSRTEGGSDDVVSFISSQLLGTDPTVRNWFSQFVKSAQKRNNKQYTRREPVLQELRRYLLERFRELVPPVGKTLAESAVVQASALVRMYAALKSLATLKYDDEEMRLLLQMLSSQPPLSHAGTRFVTLAMSVIISSPYLLAGIDQERQMIAWIRQLLERENTFERESNSVTSFGEMLFLVALHFHSNQMAAISELVQNTLGMKSVVKTGSLSRLRIILTQEIFTEQMIAAHAMKIPVTQGLSASHTGYLPIHSILQLLKSRVFSRHKVPIKDWILRQLNNSTLPLHPLLPQLIECFVNTIIPKTLRTDQTIKPFEEQEILSIYADFLTPEAGETKKRIRERTLTARERGILEGEHLAPQLLMLYYVLLYQDTLHSVSQSPVLSLRPHTSYSEAMLEQIPINYLVQEAQRRQQQCASIFPALLRLLVIHYPHLCLVEDWLEDSLSVTRSSSLASTKSLLVTTPPAPTTSGLPLSQPNFRDAMRQAVENPALAVTQLTALLRQSPIQLQQFADPLVQCLPLLLDSRVPRKVLDLVQKVWFKCHCLTPRRLRMATINALHPRPPETARALHSFSEQDVISDPLIVLRCDERVFRCPPIFSIVLRLLTAYLHASNNFFAHHVSNNPTGIGLTNEAKAKKEEKKKMKDAVVWGQESACLQILLEICLPLPEEKNQKGELTALREIRCNVFSFIHQAFIREPNVAKLVHFQGYASELIPMMVAGVPSMHINLDWICELLLSPDHEKQVFAFLLFVALCEKYPLKKTIVIARFAINVLFTILTAYESSAMYKMFVELLPSLTNLCQALPPLCQDITPFLVQVARICRSKMAITANIAIAESVESNGPTAKKIRLADDSSAGSSGNFHHLYSIVQDTFQQIAQKSISGRL